MIMMARICDICGKEIGTYNSRYTLTYKTWLYSKEKDICPLCFEKLQEQFKDHKVENKSQTDELQCGKQCHKPPSLSYRCYCDEREEDEYCNGCKFWYESYLDIL